MTLSVTPRDGTILRFSGCGGACNRPRHLQADPRNGGFYKGLAGIGVLQHARGALIVRNLPPEGLPEGFGDYFVIHCSQGVRLIPVKDNLEFWTTFLEEL